MRPTPSKYRAGCRFSEKAAFTLIELLVSISIFTVILITITSLLNVSLKQLRLAEASMGQYQEARRAFESMTRQLASSELNPYYDFIYPNDDTSKVPTQFGLQSELHFLCGPAGLGPYKLFNSGIHPTHSIFFHGAYGLTDNANWKGLGGVINSWGYYLEFGSDSTDRAGFLNSSTPAIAPRYRFRLKELQVSAEKMTTYASDPVKSLSQLKSSSEVFKWFRNLAAATPSAGRTVAENIVALVITPLQSDSASGTNTLLSPDYYYDTRAFQYATGLGQARVDRMRHRLPPLVRITMVGLDDVSAQRLQDANNTSAPDLGLDKLFILASNYDADLATLEKTLQGKKLSYRVFTNTVRLRNSRWTGTY